MLLTKTDITKSLGALTGLTIVILILFVPSLSMLPEIAMFLCLFGYLYVVIASLLADSADRTRAIKKVEQLRRKRRSEIINDILNPNQNIGEASRMTLKREAYKLQTQAEFEGENLQRIQEDIKNPVNFANLHPLTKTALENEQVRLLDLPLKAEPEDNAVIVGIGGIFGIINGLGISDAFTAYFGSLVVNVSPTFTSLTQIVTMDLSYTYRIVGFLAMIIPFIHGFILTLTSKWYHNPITNVYHLRLAFLFFIAVFIHTVLFYLLAVNVKNVSVYIIYIWSIFVFNILWLPIQSALTYGILKRTDTFLHEWIILNFITFAYLSVFIFAYPSLLQANYNHTVGQDVYLNLQIALVLTFRTASDYIVGWRKIYNKQT